MKKKDEVGLMPGNVQCSMCGNTLDDSKVECIECSEGYCPKCVEEGLKAGVCSRCQADNPVFFDSHSRTPGDVDGKHGGVR